MFCSWEGKRHHWSIARKNPLFKRHLNCILHTYIFKNKYTIILRLKKNYREFLRRYVLVPPNDDEHHDVDAAILHLVDSSFPQLGKKHAIRNMTSALAGLGRSTGSNITPFLFQFHEKFFNIYKQIIAECC